MKHYYTKVSGFFNPSQKLLYTNQVEQSKDGYHFVEIGSWKGRSASFMGVEIINSKKKIKFDAVDTWLGSTEHQKNRSVKNKTLYDEFLSNTKSVSHIVNPIKMKSVDASKLYDDSTLDFVFIDGGHEYEFVKEDIEHWYPKVRDGGVIAGDDWQYGKRWDNGVQRAVNEFFTKKPIIDRETWIYRK